MEAAHQRLSTRSRAKCIVRIRSETHADKDFPAENKHALQPYLVPSPKRGIIGNSKYASRLRQQVLGAGRDPHRAPLLIFGEPGLEKDNIAALVHFSSSSRSQLVAQLNCSRISASGAELFGKGDRSGLLDLVHGGTVILSNAEKLSQSHLSRIVELLSAADRVPRPDAPRIIFTAAKRLAALEKLATVITVPPLRVRPADIQDYQRYFLAAAGRSRNLALSREALLRIESYSFPGNVQELEAMVQRAIAQAADAGEQLTEEVFWFASSRKDRMRWNLLAALPQLKSFLRSELWPEAINFKFTVYAFPVILAILFFGPQDRHHNVALTVFWAYWWPLIFAAYPFLGRIWCAFCPFMIYGELVQRWRVRQQGLPPLMKWPREAAERWGGWFLLALFGGILVWEEVWCLEDTAALSAWLLLLITSGAVACSLVFERRFWCRYLCPIGGMNGLFAKVSMTEVRARQGVCSGNCSTYQCYKGGCAQPPEGLASPGCPVYSHPAQLADNRDCVLCMECLKACPNGSVQLRLRPPGFDLWSGHKASSPEVSMLFMLLGAVFLHRLPALCQQLGLDPLALNSNQQAHVLTSMIVLLAPGAVAAAVDSSSRLLARGSSQNATPRAFLEVAYGYVPLVWAATLAHYLDLLLTEGGTLLPLSLATVGLGDLWDLPSASAHPAVISFLKGLLLLSGCGLSLALTRKLAAVPWAQLLPQCAALLLLTAELWAVIL